jgi:hypothetical protein
MSEESEALKEAAKAAQEIAKTAGKAIDATRSAGGWLDRIFGDGIEHAVARRWSDRELVRRIEAAILDWGKLELLLHKVEKSLREEGITKLRMPPPKIMLPLLEHATMEHEDDLHTLYANLLATAVDASTEEIERIYVSVLAELSGRDVRVLRKMFAEWSFWREREAEIGKKSGDRYGSGISGLPENDETSVVLLYRLGLILPTYVEVKEYQSGGHDDRFGDYAPRTEEVVVSGDLQSVAFTEFGERFCKAVIGNVTGIYEPPSWLKEKAK